MEHSILTRAALLVACALAGCSKPRFDDCGFTCVASDRCPEGLSCVDGFCRASDAEGTCEAHDPDGSVADAADADAEACDAFPFAPSNLNGCEVMPSGSWIPEAGSWVYETMENRMFLNFVEVPVPFATVVIPQQDGPMLRVAALDELVIGAGVVLRATGSGALVILAQSAAIDGTIDVSGNSYTSEGAGVDDCVQDAGDGGASTVDGEGAAGGGGGGHRRVGGAGGDSENAVGGTGGGALSAGMLVPLVAGCRGGAGGLNIQANQGLPGRGGGALQITSALDLIITGMVNAGGGGGQGGDGGTSAGGGGGGGGGSGGSILLEAQSIEVVASALVCAGGGGGGHGGPSGGMDGQDGCDGIPASGGGTFGGDGGTDTPPQPGVDNLNETAGGGGGGSAGRIVVRGIESEVLAGGTMIPSAD